MKMRKEVLYFPLFIGLGYMIDYVFRFVIGRNELMFLREYLFLILVGIFISVESLVRTREKKSDQFDPVRFCFTVLPLFIFLSIKVGIYWSTRRQMAGEEFNNTLLSLYLNSPYPIYRILDMPLYDKVGTVLLTYFTVASIPIHKKRLPVFEQKEEKEEKENIEDTEAIDKLD